MLLDSAWLSPNSCLILAKVLRELESVRALSSMLGCLGYFFLFGLCPGVLLILKVSISYRCFYKLSLSFGSNFLIAYYSSWFLMGTFSACFFTMIKLALFFLRIYSPLPIWSETIVVFRGFWLPNEMFTGTFWSISWLSGWEAAKGDVVSSDFYLS